MNFWKFKIRNIRILHLWFVRAFFLCKLRSVSRSNWSHSRWQRAYQSITDNTSVTSSNYLHPGDPPSNLDHPRRTNSDDETVPKTVTFDRRTTTTTTPKTVAPSPASTVSPSTEPPSDPGPPAAAITATANTRSPGHPQFSSPPHTLRSDNVTHDQIYSQLDFRSSSGNSRRDDERNVCVQCRQRLVGKNSSSQTQTTTPDGMLLCHPKFV